MGSGSVFARPPLDTTVRIMLFVWFVLLLPCLIFAAMSAMAFEDDGYTVAAFAVALVPWLYPILLATAFFYRRRRPHLVWLPALSFVAYSVVFMLLDPR